MDHSFLSYPDTPPWITRSLSKGAAALWGGTGAPTAG